MIIRQISWMPFRLPFAGAFTTAHGTMVVREGLLVRLAASGGLEGLGEAAPLPDFGAGTQADALGVLESVAPGLIGRDLDRADALLATLDLAQPGAAATACALDTALCDIAARRMDLPIARLLSGAAGQTVPVNATIGVADPAAACLAAERALAAGFKHVKLKVGVAGARQAEIDRIAAVRAALGSGIRLRLDANGAWDRAEAIAIIRAAERYALELVEQPVAAGDLEGMAQVRSAVATPIGADESVRGPEQARRVVEAGAADVLIVKPMLAGGLRRSRQIVELALAAGLEALVTSTIDAGVGVAAALHLAATLPTPRACGLATAALLAGDLLTCPLAILDGTMHLPSGPGLGVALDAQALARYGGAWHTI